MENLTERETEVLQLLVTGLSNKNIGKQLGISPKTIENHLRLIYAKLGVKCRSEAVAYSLTKKLIDPTSNSEKNYASE